MPRCYKCGREIDCLVIDRTTHIFQDVTLGEDNTLEYSDYNDGSGEIDERQGFYCPECNALLTTKEDVVKEILSGMNGGKKIKF